MKIAFIILNSLAIGWYLRSAVEDASQGVTHWKYALRWASLGAANVAAILVLF